MKIHYFGHSAFALESGEHTVLIDPYISGNPHMQGRSLPAGLKVSSIIATHGHGDHLGDAPALSKQHRAPITAVAELAGLLAAKGCPTVSCGLGGKIQYEWGWSRFVPAFHSSSFEGQYAGNAAGVIISIGGVIVYHAGDTCLFGDMKLIGERYKPQVAMLPIGSGYTMDIQDAAYAAQLLNAPWVIPMHYNTFAQVNADPQVFKETAEAQTASKVHVMQPLEIWEI
ncbi:MAG: metal-dependent hydrolase [bacterium]|nr:metal-dependent hydrolase [bacterium]